jgi:hypothetical protein
MPTRLWFWGGALVVLLAASVIVITSLPRDGGVAGSNLPAIGAGGEAEGGGPAAIDGAPAAGGEPAIADPALVNDVASFAAARQSDLPAVDARAAAIPVTLVAVAADGAALSIEYTVAIDAANFEVAAPRVAVVPGLDVLECDEYACFEFTPEFAAAACADAELAALLARGATATFTYRDVNQTEIGRIPVSGGDCGPGDP